MSNLVTVQCIQWGKKLLPEGSGTWASSCRMGGSWPWPRRKAWERVRRGQVWGHHVSSAEGLCEANVSNLLGTGDVRIGSKPRDSQVLWRVSQGQTNPASDNGWHGKWWAPEQHALRWLKARQDQSNQQIFPILLLCEMKRLALVFFKCTLKIKNNVILSDWHKIFKNIFLVH